MIDELSIKAFETASWLLEAFFSAIRASPILIGKVYVSGDPYVWRSQSGINGQCFMRYKPRAKAKRDPISEKLEVGSSETTITSFRRCFLGADDQLSLTTLSIYGEAFVALLAEHRAAASTNDDVVVEAENSSESEDGDSFIDIIGEADL
ncbi:Pogo transposable element [Phytophthora cinnamomi]|uniref:Pogo transposable element n=1 Tax=Phytophthora cinnamomi TaxID=4785 RepID=UPI00355A2963|nr:Pogo transposable element [Phytophthora cinnamomi]